MRGRKGEGKAQGCLQTVVSNTYLPRSTRPSFAGVAFWSQLAPSVHTPANAFTKHKELKEMWAKY